MPLVMLFLITVQLGSTHMSLNLTNSGPADTQSVVWAVLDSYDIDKPFYVNFFSLLHLLCPHSVQCNAENNRELNYSYLDDRMKVTFALSQGLPQNRNESLMKESKSYLKSVFSDMHSCCQKCYCTDDCKERNNCCPLLKKEVIRDKQTVRQRCILPDIYGGTSHDETENSHFLMTTDCLNTSVGEDVVKKCQYPNIAFQDEIVPMYSRYSDIIYRNKYCAQCNNEFMLVSWQLIVREIDLLPLFRLPDSFEKLYQANQRCKCIEITIEMPNEIVGRKEEFQCFLPLLPVHDWCLDKKRSDKDQDNFFLNACSYYQSTYKHRYNNVFCYICATHLNNINGSLRECEEHKPRFDMNSFTAIMLPPDNTHTGNSIGLVTSEFPCNCMEYFDKTNDTCRPILCPPGKTYLNCSCESFLANMTGMLAKLFLDVRLMTPSSHVMELFNDKVPEMFVKGVQRGVNNFFRNHWGPMKLHHIYMYRETSLSNRNHLKLHMLMTMRSKLAVNNINLMINIYDLLYSGMKITIFKTPMRISLGEIANTFVDHNGNALFENNGFAFVLLYNEIDTKFKRKAISVYQTLNKLLFCNGVKLHADEMSMLTNMSLNSGYRPDELSFVYDKLSQKICFDDFINIFHDPNSAAFQNSQSRSQVLNIIVSLSILIR